MFHRLHRPVARLLTMALLATGLVLPVGTALPSAVSAGPAPAPTITSFTPTKGGFSGGTTVVITGTGLSGATAVTFGDDPAASFTVDSATQITAITPSHAVGPVDVTITRGTTATAGSQFVYQPEITLLDDFFDPGDPDVKVPFLLATGSDGSVWATQFTLGSGDNNSVFKIQSDGTTVTYTAPSPITEIQSITAGADGNMWATGSEATGGYRHLLRITPDGTFTDLTDASLCDSQYVVSGGDGNIWLVNTSGCGTSNYNAVRVTPDGTFTAFPVASLTTDFNVGFVTAIAGDRIFIADVNGTAYVLGTDGSVSSFIPCNKDPLSPLQALNSVIGPDGNLWVTCYDSNGGLFTPGSGYLARVTLGAMDISLSAITYYDQTDFAAMGVPFFITIGADGNIWVSQIVGQAPPGSPAPFDPSGQFLRISFPDDYNTPVIEDFDSDILFAFYFSSSPDGYMYAGQFSLFVYYATFLLGTLSEILEGCFQNNTPECAAIGVQNFNSVGGIFKVDVGTAPAPTVDVPTAGAGTIGLSWQAPARSGAGPILGYRIKYSTHADMSDATVIDTGDTSLSRTLSSLPNGRYYVRIATTNALGTGPYSQLRTVDVLTPEPPAAPTGVEARPGNGSASIAFTPGDDGGAPITKYQYRVGKGAWTDAVGTSSPLTVSGLTNYQTSTIRIRAVNSVGSGAPSTPVQVWPRRAAPSLTSVVSIGTSGIRARFGVLTVPGGTVSHYWVFAYEKGTDTVVSACRSTAAARTCNLTGLTAGTEYDVAVRGFFFLPGLFFAQPTLDSTRQTIRVNS